MNSINELVYTGRVHTTGGRDGASRSDDGRLDVKLTHGPVGDGTNPEQLLAAGWSACFVASIQIAGREQKVSVPRDLAVNAEIDLGKNDDGHLLGARLNISLPGVEPDVARALVEAAHQICPYSKATRGNINVELNLV